MHEALIIIVALVQDHPLHFANKIPALGYLVGAVLDTEIRRVVTENAVRCGQYPFLVNYSGATGVQSRPTPQRGHEGEFGGQRIEAINYARGRECAAEAAE